MAYKVLYNARTKVEIATIVIHLYFIWVWAATKYVSRRKNIQWKIFSWFRIICAIFSICGNTRDPFNGQVQIRLVYVLLYLYGYTAMTTAMLETLRNEESPKATLTPIGRAARTRALHCIPFPLLLAAMIMNILQGKPLQQKIASILEMVAVAVPIFVIVYLGIACIVRLDHKQSRTSRTGSELGCLLCSMPFALVVLAVRESRYLKVDIIFYPSLGMYVGCGILMEFLVVFINAYGSFLVFQEMIEERKRTQADTAAAPAPFHELADTPVSAASNLPKANARSSLARAAELDYYSRGNEEIASTVVAQRPARAPVEAPGITPAEVSGSIPAPAPAQPTASKAPKSPPTGLVMGAKIGARLMEAKINGYTPPTESHPDCTPDESLFRNACTGAEEMLATLDGATNEWGIISSSAVRRHASQHVTKEKYMNPPPLAWWGIFIEDQLERTSRDDKIRAVYTTFMEMQFDPPQTRKRFLEDALWRRSTMTQYKGLVDWPWAKTSWRGKEIDDQIAMKMAMRGW